jgi:hypothetical protein
MVLIWLVDTIFDSSFIFVLTIKYEHIHHNLYLDKYRWNLFYFLMVVLLFNAIFFFESFISDMTYFALLFQVNPKASGRSSWFAQELFTTILLTVSVGLFWYAYYAI